MVEKFLQHLSQVQSTPPASLMEGHQLPLLTEQDGSSSTSPAAEAQPAEMGLLLIPPEVELQILASSGAPPLLLKPRPHSKLVSPAILKGAVRSCSPHQP